MEKKVIPLPEGTDEPNLVEEANEGTAAVDRLVHQVSTSAPATSSVLDQWSLFAVDDRHARPLHVWHTFCFCLNTAMAAVVSVYGWSISDIPWPYVIPACTLTVHNTLTVAAYLTFGPARAHSLSLWQLVGPIAGPQLMYVTLMPIFSSISKVCSTLVHSVRGRAGW